MKSKKDDDARVRLPRELWREVQHAAVDAEVSPTEWAARVLREALAAKQEGS